MNNSEKRLLRYIEIFKRKLETPNAVDAPEEEDTEADD